MAVIIRGGLLLTVRRTTPSRIYYVLPGGSVEAGESFEEACQREAKEETGLTIQIQREVLSLMNGDRLEHYFLATSSSGAVCLGEPEATRNSPDNRYELVWVDVEQLLAIPLFPEEAQRVCHTLLAELHT